LLADGVSIYDIDLDRLAALAPDVIVTQDQCEVCAVPLAEVERAARQVLGSAATIVSLTPIVLDDVWDDVMRVAAALGREDAGRVLVRDARARLAAIAAAVAGRERPVVACIEWLDPVMVAGNWIPELVTLAGGAYPFVEPGAPTVVSTWDAVAGARPDVIVLMPCGFTIAQTRRELDALGARADWQRLAAVRDGRASVVDGNAYLNRPGPRLVESAEILAALAHPAARAWRVPQGAIVSAGAGRTSP
jgi:iron complex transport system substrate-binding protein